MLCSLCAAVCVDCQQDQDPLANDSLAMLDSTRVTVCPTPDFDPIGSLEGLLRNQSRLIDRFEELLRITPRTPAEAAMFLASFEDLLRRQAMLLSSFEDILKSRWQKMSSQEKTSFLCSFEDLIERQVALLDSFVNLSEEDWSRFNCANKTEFLSSYEDLLRRQSDLIKSYKELYMMTYGGISIEKSADKTVVHRGDRVTYTYEVTNWCLNRSVTGLRIVDNVLGLIVSDVTLGPLETEYFRKSQVITGDTCNSAKVSAKDSENNTFSDESNLVCVKFMRENKNFDSIKTGNQISSAFGFEKTWDANSLEIKKSQKLSNDDLREMSNIEQIETGDQITNSFGSGANNRIKIVTSQD